MKIQTPFGEMDEKEYRKMQIMFELDVIDSKTIRALRAEKLNISTEEDDKRLKELEKQAEQPREELKEL